MIRAPWAALLLATAGWLSSPILPANEPIVEQRVAIDAVGAAFRARRSHVQLTVEARVKRVLSDDRRGSRHQRFIVRTVSGIDVLVAYNLDLAPRITGLMPGEQLVLRGEYIWNPRGGILHWTHHDPSGRHPGGYIERHGHRYE